MGAGVGSGEWGVDWTKILDVSCDVEGEVGEGLD